MEYYYEKNKEYYSSQKSIPCNCSYCENYIKHIKDIKPQLARYLENCGVDICRPFELHHIEQNGKVCYLLCQYIVYGSCEDDFNEKIDGMEVVKSQIYPDAGIYDGDYFVLEFGSIII